MLAMLLGFVARPPLCRMLLMNKELLFPNLLVLACVFGVPCWCIVGVVFVLLEFDYWMCLERCAWIHGLGLMELLALKLCV